MIQLWKTKCNPDGRKTSRIKTDGHFFLDVQKCYPANTVYCIGSKDLCLLAFLNSRLYWFCISKISIPFGVRAGKYRFRLISQYMEQVPVKLKPDKKLSALASSMLSLHASEAAAKHPQQEEQLRRRIEATDRQIDQLVYQLYGLTDDEIKLVEQSTRPASD
jgi:hypothetical protein